MNRKERRAALQGKGALAAGAPAAAAAAPADPMAALQAQLAAAQAALAAAASAATPAGTASPGMNRAERRAMLQAATKPGFSITTAAASDKKRKAAPGNKPELPAEQWAAMRWVPPNSTDHAQLYNRVASLQTLYENHIRNWSAAEGRTAHSGKQRREHLYGPAKPAAQSPVRRGYSVILHCHFRSP
jgi:hypothetical protein